MSTTQSISGGPLRIAVLGASGYTGAELVRLLVEHPAAAIVALTADRKAGQDLGAVFPHLAGAVRERGLPPLTPREQEVLRLMAEGLPNKLIADRLGIPLRFVGVGETAEDFGVFDAETFVDAVLAPPRTGGEAA